MKTISVHSLMSIRSMASSLAASLALAVTLAATPGPSHAAPPASAKRNVDTAALPPMPLANSRSAFVGEPFFLLSDATFGTAELAKVRLEVNSPQSLEQVGGVDIVVYRIPDPLSFLARQKDLHRVQVAGQPTGEGLGNALTHVWDSWAVKSRVAWQKIFSAQARQAVVKQAPQLKTPGALSTPSTFQETPQFKPIPGLPVAERFRYPVQWAQAILPPKDLKLDGSSSAFITPTQGNVFVPIGKRAPGLYLVEAMAGQHRATTLVFVSDTVAVTKVSGDQMLVWAAQRGDGAPVPATRVTWTDGVGVLESGSTDAQGIVRFDRRAPEQTYLFGQDPAGGVFISENFYYDSEIYSAKVYAVTDRPLYRPGDTVQVKVTGREFKGARQSLALKDATIALSALDPAGQAVHTQSFAFDGVRGGDTRFALPDNANAGGYELRMAMGDDTYTAAFRVADYQKPHFEIAWVPDKADFATGEAISGKLQLNYPDGKPVARATIGLTARAQKLAMVDGELDYSGQFAVKLTQSELLTDSKGVARFTLPPAEQPSRYLLSALAADGAAYRVRTSKEILIERGSGTYRLVADRQFSKPGETVNFKVDASERATVATSDLSRPASWEWLRLENRMSQKGAMPKGDALALGFPLSGAYTVTLRDDRGRVVGAASHWVAGEGLKAPVGSIGMVFNRTSYRAGDTAEVLVSFPEPVDNALLTLERDRVEATAVMGRRADWVRSERIAPTQWKVTLPVREEMSPNMTLSVTYVKNGEHVFQNQGVLVEQPRVAVAFKTDKPVYAPGELVQVEVTTQRAGQPVAAQVTVGVVDEMIYVLQPEIAPAIDAFFFHPRRNNVRTSASLSFIGYDLATSKLGQMPSQSQVNQRAIKVLERPRRDNIDTAAWQPRLATDASGRTRFSFTMPDSLTRWRITGRAIDASGNVGQQVSWLRSDKPFYAKWTSPDWQRQGDKAQASIAVFNQGDKAAKVEWEAKGDGIASKEMVELQPGANFVALPLTADRIGGTQVTLTLRQYGRIVDQLDTPLQRLPAAWRAPRELAVPLTGTRVPLRLPADATRIRVALAQDPAAGEFNRVMADLIEFPYGCVEQTASRMLPLSIALQSMSPAQQTLAPVLAQRLASARLSLAQMAGPEARFGWWGRGMQTDAFLTSYAYYADWRAARALNIDLPDAHWQRLLDVYAGRSSAGASSKELITPGARLPLLQRALVLSWMQEMGLPVGGMVSALIGEIAPMPADKAGSGSASLAARRGSLVMVNADEVDTRDMALVLAVHTATLAKAEPSADVRNAAEAAASRLAGVNVPLVQSLLMVSKRLGTDKLATVLGQVRADVPTFDRAQTLMWLHRAMGATPGARMNAPGAAELPQLAAPWQRVTSATGQVAWQLPVGAAVPATLDLPAGAPANGTAAWAFVSFESNEAQAPALAVTLQRKLWRVVPRLEPSSAAAQGALNADLEPVEPGTPLDSNALYLDELTVKAQTAMRWALVEAALPPGAAVETGTWGLKLGKGDAARPMERAQHEATPQGYAVPLESLPAGQAVTVRHLLRFAQRGSFHLPPARVHRMYDPEAKGFDNGKDWAVVEVR